MNTKQKLEASLQDAMRSKDELRRRVLRMALASIKQIEVDKRILLDEPALINVLQKEIKTRTESIEEAKKGLREDIIAANEEESKILKEFLPAMMSEDDIRQIVVQVIAEVNASVPTDMGKVMKVILPKLEGRAANDQVSRIVREQLQK